MMMMTFYIRNLTKEQRLVFVEETQNKSVRIGIEVKLMLKSRQTNQMNVRYPMLTRVTLIATSLTHFLRTCLIETH
jgi:hypothetical protein